MTKRKTRADALHVNAFEMKSITDYLLCNVSLVLQASPANILLLQQQKVFPDQKPSAVSFQTLRVTTIPCLILMQADKHFYSPLGRLSTWSLALRH